MIRVSSCSKEYGAGPVLKEVSFEAKRGELFGIIGPNGSGKSTLLRLLSGLETPSGGTVEIDGRPVAAYRRKEIARWLAVLQQDALPPTGFTVREVVEMGRFPYQSWLGEEKDPDQAQALIEASLSRMGLAQLADRPVERLSGGERQRTALAKAMVQQPRLLLLDEPTNFLDIGYQIQLMDSIRQWQRETGLTVIAVLHDLNLASQYCDQLLLLHNGEAAKAGAPGEVLEAHTIASVYGAQTIVLSHPETGAPQILLKSAAGYKAILERGERT